MSQEVAFHAAGAGATGDIKLVGYEDVKSNFFGTGLSTDPCSMLGRVAARDPADEGLLYGFEPCASLSYDARIAPESTTERVFLDGWAPDMAGALALISRHLDTPAPAGSGVYLGSPADADDALVQRLVNASVLPDLLAHELVMAAREAVFAELAAVYVAPPGGDVRILHPLLGPVHRTDRHHVAQGLDHLGRRLRLRPAAERLVHDLEAYLGPDHMLEAPHA